MRPMTEEKTQRVASDPYRHQCDYCNARAMDRHCKVVCPNCGRYRDCSDLFD